MQIIKAIGEFGTDAVLRYREISQEPDNNVPEYFLGSFIAQRLYDRFQCRVQLERLYTDIARDLGVPASWDLTTRIGGWRADITLYQNELPPAIMELKLLDEGRPLGNVENDALKLRKFADICKIRGYVGVLICETSISLEEHVQRLEQTLQREVHVWNTQKSGDGQWRWCFGCCSILDDQRPEGRKERE